jgi:CDP-glucose 4,6-dehydratase
LSRLGADVAGISLPPDQEPNLYQLARVEDFCASYFCDINDEEKTAALIHHIQPEVVFHMAAQPLVRTSYESPLETFATNIQGTAHVLDALRLLDSVRVVVAITTDKVYRNLEHPWPYRENDRLGAHDPYSASKAAAEMIIECYRNSFFEERGVAVASARAGNVIGGGDWSKDRLIPDAVRAWRSGRTLHLRRPTAVRPWQHVLEALAGYMRLAERLWQDLAIAGAYNFGPATSEAATVREVIAKARSAYGAGEVEYGDGNEGPHEAGWLALEITKARTILDIAPRWTLEEAVERTMAWYCNYQNGMGAHAACDLDLDAFVKMAP